jgi:hypothetical protein
MAPLTALDFVFAGGALYASTLSENRNLGKLTRWTRLIRDDPGENVTLQEAAALFLNWFPAIPRRGEYQDVAHLVDSFFGRSCGSANWRRCRVAGLSCSEATI